jgi:regulator of replication initiation timing
VRDQPENLVLVYLRRLDQKVDRVIEELTDLKHRMTSVARQLAAVRLDPSHVSGRLDRLEIRMDRLERRRDLVPGTVA